MSRFDEARAQFPVLERLAYLNAGTFGPLSTSTMDAVERQLRRDLQQGRGGRPYYDAVRGLREEVRSRIAELLGVDAGNIAVTSSTTDACNIVMAGLGLTPEDEVVTTDEEHFGLLGPLQASGARVRVVPVRSLPDAITARTRLVAVSHVSWMTGAVLPLDELTNNGGPLVLVDGAQSVGAIPVDASPFDFYTVSGQKWLCGPDPTGALYVADPERLRVGRPSIFSQERYDADGTFVPRPGAARFDPGWAAPAALAGLLAAMDAYPVWRFDRIRTIAEHCRAALAERFEVVTDPGQAGLVSWRAEGDPAETVARLYERGVVIREIPNKGLLRASCGWWTSKEDVERLLAALTRPPS